MTLCCGIDGCPGGWIAVCEHAATGRWEHRLLAPGGIAALRAARPDVIVIDIPVGLPEAGSRECDRAARRYLGPARRASVFPAPIRRALGARDWGEACRMREAVEGKRYPRQVFGILAKVREIDDLLHRAPGLGGLLREGHPEVTLAAMNGGNAMRHPKKSAAGRAERLAVIRESLGDGAVELYQHAAAHYPRARVGRDDLIDALALVWTARRIASGRHLRLPREARSDALGLPMHIHY
ncbi:MAG TPA: DUF429 domain-containing protein [Gammaproteobacteria bacterium]|nr:DUF429 domain-containing protein [Gammaproteobacteria bacterium]